MNKKLIVVIVFFLAITLTLVSSSLKPTKFTVLDENDPAGSLTSHQIVVGFSQLGSESDWRTANTKSIQSSLTAGNGFSLIYRNGRQRQENQIKDVRSFIFQEVDYILIAPVTETGWDTVLEEAKTAGIPVIIVDRMIDTVDDSLYVANVGTDKYEEGIKAGKWLEKFLDQRPANIVVLEGTLNSTAQIGRTQGFDDIAAQHKEWNILAREDGDFTKAKGKEIMSRYLAEFEQIDVLVSQNDDMTFGAIEAIQEAGRTCGVDGDITIISFDAVNEAFDKMEAGLINVEIECNPLQGPLIAEILQKLEQGVPVERINYVEEEVFEAENAKSDRVGRSY